jgi:hypothetical protein
MKEYGNKLEIYILDNIASILGTSITLLSGKSALSIHSENDIIVDEQLGETNGSTYFSQNLQVHCDKLSTDDFNSLHKRKVVIKLFFGDDEEVLLGSMTYPARCKIQPHLNKDTLKITSESPDSLLS